MIKKRIIACLDIKDGRTVKGVNFIGLRDAGDPVGLAKMYAQNGIDELVFLDITATTENRKTLTSLVSSIAREIDIPFTVGGGVKSVEDAYTLLKAGADKIAINSQAIRNPQLISDLSRRFGSQCVVVAIDANMDADGKAKVFIDGGRTMTDWGVEEWALEVQKLGAGEILLTSMAHDGTKNGFDIALLSRLTQKVNIPIIASGGAGSISDFVHLFLATDVSAGLAASIFHDGLVSIGTLKNELLDANVRIRPFTVL